MDDNTYTREKFIEWVRALTQERDALKAINQQLLAVLTDEVIQIANIAMMVDEPLVNQLMENVHDAIQAAKGECAE